MKGNPSAVINRQIYELKDISLLSIERLLHKIYSMPFFSVTFCTIYNRRDKNDK